jgi:hypothetical protein
MDPGAGAATIRFWHLPLGGEGSLRFFLLLFGDWGEVGVFLSEVLGGL